MYIDMALATVGVWLSAALICFVGVADDKVVAFALVATLVIWAFGTIDKWID